MELIPAIDLRDGRCVRLLQGDFERETRYSLDPVDLAERYRELGARSLHVVDLDGAKRGVPVNLPVIRRMRAAAGVDAAGDRDADRPLTGLARRHGVRPLKRRFCSRSSTRARRSSRRAPARPPSVRSASLR